MDFQKDSIDVLAVCYGGGHVNMVVPLVRELTRRDPALQVKVLGLTNSQAVLEKAGIPYFGFRQLESLADKDAIVFGRELVRDLGAASCNVEDSIAYLGMSFSDLVDEHGEDEARRMYATRGRQAFLPTRTMTRLISTIKPRLVVATSAPRCERAAILAARQCETPSICMVDLFASKEVEWLCDNGFADRVCVISDAVKDRLVEHGRNPAHVYVTGNPAFDRLATSPDHIPPVVGRLPECDDSSFTVLFASQPEPSVDPDTGVPNDTELPSKAEAVLASIATSTPGIELIVRHHPSQGAMPRIHENEHVVYSDHRDDLGALLRHVDCVVTFSSTVGLEAALVGKPLISLSMSSTSRHVPYADMGLATGVDKLEDLEATILDSISTGERNVTGIAPAGGAAARVVDIVSSYLRDSGLEGTCDV